jgi:hypothetical protein
LGVDSVYQEIRYGGAVISLPRLRPLTLNCTPTTPTLSLAVAVRITAEPDTVALLAGAVRATEGAVVSAPVGGGVLPPDVGGGVLPPDVVAETPVPETAREMVLPSGAMNETFDVADAAEVGLKRTVTVALPPAERL